MEHTRKERILSAVVKSYIRTGEPTGSKAVLSAADLSVSSATVRSELSALDMEGYLVQPHTSAGRIPTKKGYRYYIDNLMDREAPDERVREYIERTVRSTSASPEVILQRAAKVLAELSGVAAVTTTPSSEDARVHRIRFVSTGRHTAMAVLITSNGMVQSKLFRCEFVLTPELLAMYDKALNDKFVGIRLKDINKAFLQSSASGLGDLTFFISDALMALYETVFQAMKVSVTVCGSTNLLLCDGYDLNGARDVLRFLSDSERLAKLMNNSVESKIYLGDESAEKELQDSAAVVSRYDIAGQAAGAVAVIGPLRMDYETVFAQVKYTSVVVSQAIGEILDQ